MATRTLKEAFSVQGEISGGRLQALGFLITKTSRHHIRKIFKDIFGQLNIY